MNLNDTKTAELFKPLKQALRDRFVADVEKAFADWQEERGEATLPFYRYNDNSREARIYARCSRYVRTENGSGRKGDPVILSTEYLAKQADQFADDAYNGFVAKTISKIGDIDVISLQFHGGADFNIRGEVNGKAVTLEQQTVYKYSNRGTLFAQFPARIYVDGQFTPAAKFKEAVA